MRSKLLFSHPVISDSLRPHGLQHARPPCPSPSLRVCPSLCLLHQWYYPAISSSDDLFSFYPQSFPASGTFPMSWLFASGGQSTGASASASVLPMKIQLISFRIDWFDLLGVQGLLHHNLKASILQCSAFFPVQLSHLETTGKTVSLTMQTFVGKVIYLLFNTLCLS